MTAENRYDIDFSEHLYYDESSPSGLRWKQSTRQYKTGTPAGALNQGYYVFSLNRRRYFAHIVVFKLLRLDGHEKAGKKGFTVDHRNKLKTDNNRTNLRLIEFKGNTRNSGKRSTNKSGVVGVRWAEKHCNTYAVAMWTDLNGNNRSKWFSVRLNGRDGAFELACQARKTAILAMNEQGAGYTEDHL